MSDFTSLPDDLPAPQDDGGADHLPGMKLPSAPLPSTSGETVDPSALSSLTVVYCYPMTGRPDAALPDGWDGIPGARGCTPQSCSFRDRHEELRSLGVSYVFGVSTQSTAYQREAKERLNLTFDLLSDSTLAFRDALRLPTLEVRGDTLLKRLTLILRGGGVEHVFYPVFPPDRSAQEVIEWLTENWQ
ncbi:peroxiredoxin [Rubrobacter indicoceani]|uniref:peroxiredoxin n=1 Tax=Rubrobacter indicoceani TaxID=2051957 RepID=UPI001F08FEDC|nr:peroxiredoxin [Rubrobacter indicoceani]